MSKALVILSGGQDSTTCLALAMKTYDEVAAITFDYGQRHSREIQAARDVAKLCGVTNHEVLTIGAILEGTSPLTDQSQPLEQYQNYASMDAIIGSRVEKTFVPMRNALFLTIAANRAVCMGATYLVTGVCEADNANYPDCRQAFIKAQELAINAALGFGWHDADYINIVTPLMYLTKAQSIQKLTAFGGYPLLAFTHTAYDGQYPPVGQDHASVLRAQGFVEAGVPDPLIVRAAMEGLLQTYPATKNYADWRHTTDLTILMANIQTHTHSLGLTKDQGVTS